MNLKMNWKKQMEKEGFKYFVIKMEDLFESLDENWINGFDQILKKYNNYRESKGKQINNYYVVNRDEKYSNEIKQIIEKNEGIKF